MTFLSLFAHSRFGAALQAVQQEVRRLIARANEDNLDQIAGSLTFLTLLAIVPFITLGLALFAAFPVFADFKNAIAGYLQDSFLPEETGEMVMSHIADFAANAAQLTAAGLAALALTVLMLAQTIERSFDRIWRVQQGRSVMRRLLLYTVALAFGPLLVGGSLAATTFLITASMGLLPVTVWLDKLVLTAFPVVMTACAFTLLFRGVPNCAVRWCHALGGGVLAAIGFEVMKILFGIYIAAFPSYQMIYGAFAAIPIFLIWVYLSWMITLTGALVVAALSTSAPAPVSAPVPHNSSV